VEAPSALWSHRRRSGTREADGVARGTVASLCAAVARVAIPASRSWHGIAKSEFAAAITAALPQARQVADRWHLAANLTEHLNKVVAARWKPLTQAARPQAAEAVPEQATVSPPPPERHPSAGEARYQQVLALAQTHLPIRLIAQRVGVSTRTIERWLAKPHGPYANSRKPRRSPLNWITLYLHKRWEAGERNGMRLWKELRAQGYTGSRQSVYRRLERWRVGPRRRDSAGTLASVPPSPLEDLSPSKVIGWIIARPGTLAPEVEQRLEIVCHLDPPIGQARNLTRRWLGFIRAHTSDGLDAWLEEMRSSTLPTFVSFADSVEREKAAIVAGLTLPYSTGPVEGHNNRLKLIKRQAYGQAALSYLQHRFLPAA
jgi:transposase